jgi:hypothetical protein
LVVRMAKENPGWGNFGRFLRTFVARRFGGAEHNSSSAQTVRGFTPSMSQPDGRKLSEFDGVQSSIRRKDEGMCHPSLPKMLSVANAFKISDHQYNPR